MSTGISLATAVGYIAVLIIAYFGITRTSNFTKQPEEKQLADKKRLKIALIIGSAIGLYQIFTGSTNT